MKGISILVVDDSKVMRTIIIQNLQQIGMVNIEEAVDGMDAMAKISRKKYSMITLDISMPKLDGLAVLKYIKEVSPTSRIIMCSAVNEQNTVKTAVGFGVHGFIMKPFTVEKLRQVLQENIQQCKQ